MGGDEFVILCEDTELAQAHGIASRVLETATSAFHVGELSIRTSASVGVATAQGALPDVEDLLRNADVAMYSAKRSGRNRIAAFDDELRDQVDARREMEVALGQAFAHDEIELAYQPMIRLGTDDVVAFEALARWDRPGHGPVAPSEFIPLAEKSVLIHQLGDRVLEQACRCIARWEQMQGTVPLVSVNVSARQFENGALVQTITRVLNETGIDPGHLMLEITESVLVSDVADAVSQLRAVRALGVQVAVDDFGTGHSALAYLRRFPIDVVKIDRMFVEQLGIVSPAATVISAVVNLAHSLDYNVVVEGVETKDQLDMLRAFGCDWVQGFYLSQPVSEVEATRHVLGVDRHDAHTTAPAH